MSRRFVRLVLTVCPLLLSGCIIPYTYPRLSCTPGLAFDAPVEVVHAFRVDFTNYTADIGSFLPEDGVQQLSEISLDSAPNVPAQAKLSVDYGFLLIGVALNYFIHTNHTVGLRIYRPGFELVEIHSWERGEQIAWKPATDIAAREETLHRLFPISRLDPECKTEQHKAALLFGVSEYDRLAAEALDDEDRSRLRSHAVFLRERTILQKPDFRTSKDRSSVSPDAQ